MFYVGLADERDKWGSVSQVVCASAWGSTTKGNILNSNEINLGETRRL